MEIEISTEVESRFKDASRILGFVESEILERAILFYLTAVQNEIEMNKEFQELDLLSDEALTNFEENL